MRTEYIDHQSSIMPFGTHDMENNKYLLVTQIQNLFLFDKLYKSFLLIIVTSVSVMFFISHNYTLSFIVLVN